MARKKKRSRSGCRTVVFKKSKGKTLPKSKWRRVTFCR